MRMNSMQPLLEAKKSLANIMMLCSTSADESKITKEWVKFNEEFFSEKSRIIKDPMVKYARKFLLQRWATVRIFCKIIFINRCSDYMIALMPPMI